MTRRVHLTKQRKLIPRLPPTCLYLIKAKLEYDCMLLFLDSFHLTHATRWQIRYYPQIPASSQFFWLPNTSISRAWCFTTHPNRVKMIRCSKRTSEMILPMMTRAPQMTTRAQAQRVLNRLSVPIEVRGAEMKTRVKWTLRRQGQDRQRSMVV